MTKRSDCKACPFKRECIGKGCEKRIDITHYNEYQRAIARVKSQYERKLKRRRSAMVEPVFGTLTQCLGLRMINTRGIENANKVMLAAAIAHNLKKHLKFSAKTVQTAVRTGKKAVAYFLERLAAILRPNTAYYFPISKGYN